MAGEWETIREQTSFSIRQLPTGFLVGSISKLATSGIRRKRWSARRTNGKFGSGSPQYRRRTRGLSGFGKNQYRLPRQQHSEKPEIINAYSYARDNKKKIHFLGLVSDGGVHSSLDHLLKLIDIAKEYNAEAYVHCFMDGRDTDPKSGKGFIEQLDAYSKTSTTKIASVVGRYYAMDRDKRWERVKEAYNLIVNGKGTPATDMIAAMQTSYDAGVTDEFIKPIVAVDAAGKPLAKLKPATW